MKKIETSLPGVYVIEHRCFRDERGHFFELWNRRSFEEVGIGAGFVQDNVSTSKQGVLRGLHFQLGKPQSKLVTCLQGEIFDVAVDVRRGSPTFGRWVGVKLCGEDPRALLIPEGFAHGFLVLSKTADVVYKAGDFYSAPDERGVVWDDPTIGISWPTNGITPVLNPRDKGFPTLAAADLPEYTP